MVLAFFEGKLMTKEKNPQEITITLSKERFINWCKLSLLGGVFVIAPISVIYFIFQWLFNQINSWITPITSVLERFLGFSPLFSDIVALALISAVCFFTGVIVKTRFGGFFHSKIEKVMSKVPGYVFVRDLLKQVLSGEGFSFTDKKAAIVEPYGKGNGKLVGFIMDKSEKLDLYSVFCPSAPNPTSGYTFTVSGDQIKIVEKTPSEEVLKIITLCGMGTAKLLEELILREEAEEETVEEK